MELFAEGAEAVLDFEFDEMGLEELGAREVTENSRDGALQKVDALQSMIPFGLVLNGPALDQYLWTISGTRIRSKIVWDLRMH